MRIFIIFIVAVFLTALFVYNPEMDDFKGYIEGRSEELLQREIGDSALGRALSGLGSSLAGSYVDPITDRKNYYLFSTYAIGSRSEEEQEKAWVFLGVGGQFLEIQKPNGNKSR